MSNLSDLVLDIQAKLAQKWANSAKINSDYNANSRAINAVLDNQQIAMPELSSNGKNKKLRIEWLDSCSDTLSDCTDSCDIEGSISEPNSAEYELQCLKEYKFQVNRDYRNSYQSREDHFADKFGTANKLFAEWLSKHIISNLILNSGVNKNTTTGTAVGTITYLPTAAWNDNIWGYFALCNELNDMNQSYFIDGGNLFNLVYSRIAEKDNADGKGNFNKFKELSLYSDIKNIAAISPNSTFQVSQNAIAFINHAWYNGATATNPIQLDANTIGYEMALPFDERVKFDVRVQRKCENGVYFDAVELKLWGLVAFNPTPCASDIKGILHYVNGNP